MREILVVSLSFPLLGLVLFAKMAAARFVSMDRVVAHQLGELEEVPHPTRLLEGLVEVADSVRRSRPLERSNAIQRTWNRG